MINTIAENTITYEVEHVVYMGGDEIGVIRRCKDSRKDGWAYCPYRQNKRHHGEIYPTVAEVKRSLETG